MALRAAIAGIRHPHVFVRHALLEAAPDVEVVGVYDADAALGAEFAARTGLWQAPTLDALLDRGVDLLVSEALDSEMPDLALAAAPRVRAMLLEKPGAPTAAEMKRLVAGLAAHPVHVEVAYQLAHSPAVTRTRELLAAGALGQVTLARLNAGCPVGCGDELWQSVPGDRGGVLFTEGCHMLQLLIDAFGAPDAVTGMVAKLPVGAEVRSDVVKRDLFDPPAPGDVTRVGALMYEDVAAAVLRYPTFLATLDVTAWEATDWVENWWLELQGTNGTLCMRPLAPTVELILREPHGTLAAGVTRQTWETTAAEGEPTLVPDIAYERQLDALLARLREGAPPSQSRLRVAADVVRVLDAIYRASDSGTTVALGQEVAA